MTAPLPPDEVPERKCNGGQKGPWCGKPSVFVVTEGKVAAKRDWEGMQWFTCAEHTEGNATEPIAEFFARLRAGEPQD